MNAHLNLWPGLLVSTIIFAGCGDQASLKPADRPVNTHAAAPQDSSRENGYLVQSGRGQGGAVAPQKSEKESPSARKPNQQTAPQEEEQ